MYNAFGHDTDTTTEKTSIYIVKTDHIFYILYYRTWRCVCYVWIMKASVIIFLFYIKEHMNL